MIGLEGLRTVEAWLGLVLLDKLTKAQPAHVVPGFHVKTRWTP